MWRSVSRTVATLLGATGSISASLLLFQPETATYRGLSGLDSALFRLLAAMIWRESRRDGRWKQGAVGITAGAAFLAKSAYELATGTTLFVDSSAAGLGEPSGRWRAAAVLQHSLGACGEEGGRLLSRRADDAKSIFRDRKASPQLFAQLTLTAIATESGALCRDRIGDTKGTASWDGERNRLRSRLLQGTPSMLRLASFNAQFGRDAGPG